MRGGFFYALLSFCVFVGDVVEFLQHSCKGGGWFLSQNLVVIFNKIGVLWLLQACFCKWQLSMFATSVFPTPCVDFCVVCKRKCVLCHVILLSNFCVVVFSNKTKPYPRNFAPRVWIIAKKREQAFGLLFVVVWRLFFLYTQCAFCTYFRAWLLHFHFRVVLATISANSSPKSLLRVWFFVPLRRRKDFFKRYIFHIVCWNAIGKELRQKHP